MFPALQGVFYEISKKLDVGWKTRCSRKNITDTLERNILQHQPISWKLLRAFRSHPNRTCNQAVLDQILCPFFLFSLVPFLPISRFLEEKGTSDLRLIRIPKDACCYSQPRFNKAANLFPKLEKGGTLITIHCRSANVNDSFVAF